MSSKERKTQIIESLKQLFSQCSIAILTDYRGQSANEMAQLRRRLRELGIDYKVVKNTLARFAAQRAGREELVSFFEGPVAIAFGYGNITEPAKALVDYIQTSKASMSIKGGFLSNRLLMAEDVVVLSTLPAREVLLAEVLAGMQTPISALVSHLTTPIRGIIRVLQARIQQLEGG